MKNCSRVVQFTFALIKLWDSEILLCSGGYKNMYGCLKHLHMLVSNSPV